MKFAAFTAIIAAGSLAAGAASAAQVFNIEVWLQGAVPSANNFADPAHVPIGPASVTFDWTGAINWSDISPQNSTPAGGKAIDLLDGYATQLSNFATVLPAFTFADFLNTSLTINGDAYTTFFRIATTYISAAPIVGTFTHDDGATIYVDNILVGGSAPETVAVTHGYSLPGGPGAHDLKLYYVTGNGTPSVLNFDPGLTTVPEPGAWALMIMGFGAAGAVIRRRRNAAPIPV
ncbi:PEPxxWA-CTERM sorting domain-containing protein [uncultured Phenylobacterium sp.]|uniref:PEPxxWA-CTERM sorting domain-containing protein n=1 Tax=uncultured Phenylobacterium sp. TaxID=349273 RepID=UPI0025D0F2E5|nr:PEPxxWA-CTERM sorting domain-containing protein [uncultured Phenylobacterium sp.]